MKVLPILFLFILSATIFAVGGGADSSLTESARYRFTLNAIYDCNAKVIKVNITGVEGTGARDGFKIDLIKDTFVIATDHTDKNGLATMNSQIDGTYVVRATRTEYFEQSKAIQVANCETKVQKFLCSEGKTMKERVRCVLNLPDEDVNAVKYLPEECMAMKNEEEKDRCVDTYRMLQGCRTEGSDDAGREVCARQKLNLTRDITDSATECNKEPGVKKRLCLIDLKNNIFTLVKFRIYNLAYKAYELRETGMDEDSVVNFTVLLNEKKIAFNLAQTIDDKKKIVNEVKQEWEKFRANAKKQLGGTK